MHEAAGPVAPGVVVGAVQALWRFPVKSTAGESLSAAVVEERGLVDDRCWAVYTADGGIASGKTTRRFRKVDGLLRWRATMPPGDSSGLPLLTSPDGRDYRVDDPAATVALSEAFDQPLTLRAETSVRHHDESAVHLVTTSALRAVDGVVGGSVEASVGGSVGTSVGGAVGRAVDPMVGRAVDARRLRANLVLETSGGGYVEDSWAGALLAVGPEVVLRIGPGMPRCVMVDRPQAGVPDGPPVLKSLGRTHDLLLGAQASVLRTGTVRLGDVARLIRR